MNRNGNGPLGPPTQSYNVNSNEKQFDHTYGLSHHGNGAIRQYANQKSPMYQSSQRHEQTFHENTATTTSQAYPFEEPHKPRTHFEQCIPRTRTIAHYKRIEQIGEGTYGQVYKASCLSTNRIVALKKIRLTSVATEGLPRTVIREIKILKALQHENMVQMLEVVSSKGFEYLDEEDEHKEDKKRRLLKDEANNIKGDKESSSKEKNNNNDTLTEREKYKGNLFLVLEYISHDLSGILDMGVRFEAVQSKYIFHQLLSVLNYMHEQKYVHRDLKSSNILIDKRYKVKLADFGLARSIDDEFDWQNDERKSRKLTNKVVTIWYRSPELLLGATDYDEKVDIWSAGCILAELLLGKALFPGTNEVEQLRLIFKMMGTPNEGNWEGLKSYPKIRTKEMEIGKQMRAEFRDKYGADDRFVSSPSAIALIERLLELDPKKRWRAKQALDSQYFRSKPTVPLNQDALGTIPIFGDSHEFQTKPIRKQAKIVAQKASADAKKRGDNEKEAYESAYKEFLAKTAETGTFELKHEEQGLDKNDRDRGKERSKDRDRESDKERKRRRRDRDERRDKREHDNEHDLDRREREEQRDKRQKRGKVVGEKKRGECIELRDRVGTSKESNQDREKTSNKSQRDRNTDMIISNEITRTTDDEDSGRMEGSRDEKEESRFTGDTETRPEKVNRASHSHDRDDKEIKKGRRDNKEFSRDRKERKRSRERKERRDKDRGRNRDGDRRNRDKDRKERNGELRKDKDKRDKDRRRGSRDRTRSGSRDRSRRSKESNNRDRNRDRNRRTNDVPKERRRDEWGHSQGRRGDDREYGWREQYSRDFDGSRDGYGFDGPPGRGPRDGSRYRDDRQYRR